MVYELRERILDYKSFISIVKQRVKSRLGDNYSVEIYKVIKNNSLELDSLVLLKKGKNFTPSIYLQPYYESYLWGTTIEDIVERLCSIYHHCSIPIVNKTFTYDFEEMKAFIIYRLVSYEKNKKLLATVPHKKYLDLAITYHCLVRDDVDGIGTIRICNNHLDKWKVSIQDIDILATVNTPQLMPATINTMDEVIRKILCSEMAAGNLNGISSDNLEEILSINDMHNNFNMYILSNHKGINGAACILYSDVIHDFAKQINSDLYILPSSIHEVILVPKGPGIDKRVLRKMVQDVNRTQVPPEEVLSDRVYYYSREYNGIIC